MLPFQSLPGPLPETTASLGDLQEAGRRDILRGQEGIHLDLLEEHRPLDNLLDLLAEPQLLDSLLDLLEVHQLLGNHLELPLDNLLHLDNR